MLPSYPQFLRTHFCCVCASPCHVANQDDICAVCDGKTTARIMRK
uniref:Uncharacterized protein n=1 Tax=Arundo donax TaxID=35708 RepID=A0A0A8YJ41_ARUDO